MFLELNDGRPIAALSQRSTGAGGRERYRHQFVPLPALPMQCPPGAPGAACRAQRQVMAQQYPDRAGDHAQMKLIGAADDTPDVSGAI